MTLFGKIKSDEGFTLVELVLVMVVVGILAVYVAPRAFDRSEIASVTYQNRAISILRNMQVRAMQDTRGEIVTGYEYCYQVVFDSASSQFGIPSNTFNSADPVVIQQSCDNVVDTSDPAQLFYVPSESLDSDFISVDAYASDGAQISSIIFDNMGRANQTSRTCDGRQGCEIVFSGRSTSTVCVESEGYIYACN